MKKLFALFLAVLFVASMLAGCGGGSASSAPAPASAAPAPQPAPAPPAQPSVLTVTFSNATDYIFNEIYISPTAANDWGEELLGSTSVLKSNGSVDIDVPAYDYENYDIQVVDEDGDEYTFTYVPLQNGSEVAIYFGDDGLAADVYDDQDNTVATVAGTFMSDGDGSNDGNDDGGDMVAPPTPQPTVTGTGNDTNGQYTFTVYNESAYDIYAIHMGVVNAAADYDIDILPQILPAGESTELVGLASQGDWMNTEWSLYITDVDGDRSVSYDSFNPWTVSYVDIYWDSDSYGYICEFVY